MMFSPFQHLFVRLLSKYPMNQLTYLNKTLRNWPLSGHLRLITFCSQSHSKWPLQLRNVSNQKNDYNSFGFTDIKLRLGVVVGESCSENSLSANRSQLPFKLYHGLLKSTLSNDLMGQRKDFVSENNYLVYIYDWLFFGDNQELS